MARKSRNSAAGGMAKIGKSAVRWDTYEEVARYIIQQAAKIFRLSDVEGKQKILGKLTGTKWEIDAKGIRENGGAIVIIECRRHTTSRLSQEAIAAVAYRILDAEADGGIVVSPHPLQIGAKKVAKAAKIEHIRLDPSSTKDQWIAQVEDLIMIGFTENVKAAVKDSFSITVYDVEGNVIESRSS